MEWYKWPDINKSVENTDFSSWEKKEEVYKKIDSILINDKEKLDTNTLNKLENSSIEGLDEKSKVVDFILENSKNQSEIDSNIKVIIDNYCVTLDNVKEVIKVENEDVKVEDEDFKVENEVSEVDKDNKIFQEKITNILINLKWENSKEYNDLILLLDKWNFKEIIKELKNPNTLKFVVKDLIKQDEENWTNNFKSFRANIWAIDKNLGNMIDNIYLNDAKAQLILGSDNLGWVDIWKNVLSKDTEDWFNVSAWKDWRSLSLDGSDYKIDASLDNSEELEEIKEVESDMKRELKPINDVLNSVSNILRYVENAISSNIDLDEVKNAIRENNLDLYNELNIDWANSLIEIKQNLSWFYKKKEEEKDNILKEKKQILDEIIIRNTDKAKERDENKKETLKFLHKIGFDLIPQDDLEKIMNQIWSWRIIWNNKRIWRWEIQLGEDFSLNKWVDFSEWLLGFDDWIDWVSDKEKETFIRLYNKILSWNPNKPVNIKEAIYNDDYEVTDTVIQSYRAKMYDWATFNTDEILDNLVKPVSDEIDEKTK